MLETIKANASTLLTYLDSHEFIAGRDTQCLRKGVACSVLGPELQKLYVTINGPVGSFRCRNIQGGCGCMHSEQKMMLLLALNGMLRKGPLLMLNTYSPCTTCANNIITAGFQGVIIFKYLTEHDQDGVSILQDGGLMVIPSHDLTR